MAVRWYDKCDVTMLSAIYTGKMVGSKIGDCRTHEKIWEPDTELDCVENMRSVEKSDVQIGSVESMLKAIKWCEKQLSFHLVELILLNTYNLVYYGQDCKENATATVQSQWWCNCWKGMVSVSDSHSSPTPGRGSHLPGRLVGKVAISRHFLQPVPPTGKRSTGQRQCHVCTYTVRRERKRKLVGTGCKESGAGLRHSLHE